MKNHTSKTTSIIALIGVVVLLILFVIQWYSSYSNIREYKLDKEKEITTIAELRNHALLELDTCVTNDSITTIYTSDLKVINKRYDDLLIYVENNTNKAESLIDNDLDRLNLYLAVGIGFVGVLGVFVPILVNMMSVQDLREKMNAMPDSKKVEEAALEAKLALEASTKVAGLNAKIENMEKYYQKTGPAVTSLILQNAIGRFFNVSPRLITKLKREKNRQYFIRLLETIKDGFEHCKMDDGHKVRENPFLRETIIDFRMYISDQTFQSSVFTEIVVLKFVELSDELGELVKSSNSDQENNSIVRTNGIFNDIIDNLNII